MFLDFCFPFTLCFFQTLWLAWFHRNEMRRIETFFSFFFFSLKKKLLRVRSAFFILRDQQERERESETFKYLFIESYYSHSCSGFIAVTVATELLWQKLFYRHVQLLLFLLLLLLSYIWMPKQTSTEMNLTIFNHDKRVTKWNGLSMKCIEHWTHPSPIWCICTIAIARNIIHAKMYIFFSSFLSKWLFNMHSQVKKGERKEMKKQNI